MEESSNPQADPDPKVGDRNSEGGVTSSYAAPPNETNPKGAHGWNDRRENIRFVFEMAGIVLLVYGAFLGGCTFLEMQTQTEQLKNQIRIENQARVFPSGFALTTAPQIGTNNVPPLVVQVFEQNSGNTPATIISRQVMFSWDQTCAAATDEEWALISKTAGNPQNTALYPNSEGDFFEIQVWMGDEAISRYRGYKALLCVNVRVVYRDVFGSERFFYDTCRAHRFGNGLGQFAYCDANSNRFGTLTEPTQ